MKRNTYTFNSEMKNRRIPYSSGLLKIILGFRVRCLYAVPVRAPGRPGVAPCLATMFDMLVLFYLSLTITSLLETRAGRLAYRSVWLQVFCSSP